MSSFFVGKIQNPQKMLRTRSRERKLYIKRFLLELQKEGFGLVTELGMMLMILVPPKSTLESYTISAYQIFE